MSSNYRIFETERFTKDLKQDFRGQRVNIRQKLETYVYPQLRNQPYFGNNVKKLRNWQPPTWRYRIRDWRFFYEIDEEQKIVFMIAVDSRQGSLNRLGAVRVAAWKSS